MHEELRFFIAFIRLLSAEASVRRFKMPVDGSRHITSLISRSTSHQTAHLQQEGLASASDSLTAVPEIEPRYKYDLGKVQITLELWSISSGPTADREL